MTSNIRFISFALAQAAAMSQTAEPKAGLPPAGDLLDDLLHSLELLQQPVYIHNIQTAAGGDPLFRLAPKI